MGIGTIKVLPSKPNPQMMIKRQYNNLPDKTVQNHYAWIRVEGNNTGIQLCFKEATSQQYLGISIHENVVPEMFLRGHPIKSEREYYPETRSWNLEEADDYSIF